MNEKQLPVQYTSAENSVQITLAHCSGAGAVSLASVPVAQQDVPDLRDPHVAYEPERYTKPLEVDLKLDTWVLCSALASVTALFTVLYTMCHPGLVPGFVAQTEKLSEQLTAKRKGNDSTAVGGIKVVGQTAVSGVTRNSTVSVVHHNDSKGGARQPLAPDRGEAEPRDNSRSHAHNDFHTATSVSSSSKRGLLVPPPPPTPCVLPPGYGFLPAQPAQQDAPPTLLQAQAPDSLKPHSPVEAQENRLGRSATPGRTEAAQSAAQSAALVAADRELQAAMSSSLHTVGEWTR